MDGIVFVDKKPGVTSYDAIKLVKKRFNTNKVGHCGTLDPFASGLLIIGINQATKVLNFLENETKEYIATLTLGISTDTFDLTGKEVSKSEVKSFDGKKLNEIVKTFIGEITQIPPIYSSIHVNGKHLYEYARNNDEVEIPKRNVIIHELKILAFNDNEIEFYVKCSKGTYIRTLGVDIAKKLENDGHISKLRRISIGNISIDNAINYEQLENFNYEINAIQDCLNMKKLYIDDKSILRRVYNGQDIYLKQETSDYVLIIDNNIPVSIYKMVDIAKYHCVRGLFDEDIRYKRLKEFQ